MKEMDFNFKGRRRYVHGPDIYYAFCEHIIKNEKTSPASIKLVSKHLSESQLIFSNVLIEDRTIQSVAEYTIDDDKKRIFSYESENKVTNSINYDEPDIVNNATFVDNVGRIVNYSKYNIAEISVALLKEICNRTITDSVKWIFVGLELQTNMNKTTAKEIKVEILKNLGTKMVISNLFVDSFKVGQLKFSSIAK